MAGITHADLEPGRSYRALGSCFANTLLAISFILGLLAFPLCIMAELSKSQVTWTFSQVKNGLQMQCTYTGSGLLPSAYGGCAVALLLFTFAITHMYMCTALCRPSVRESARPLDSWFLDSSLDPHSEGVYQGYKAAAFFIGSLVSFVVALVLHMMAITIELHHWKHWNASHSSCLITRKGMFTAAGVFSVACTFFGVAFYATALQTQATEEREAAVEAAAVRHGIIMQGHEPPHLHHSSSSSSSSSSSPSIPRTIIQTFPNKTLAN